MLKAFLTSSKLAFKVLRANLARTFLSLLGIVIGVTAVVVVISLGLGLREFIVAQVEMFGTDTIEIEIKTPKTSHMSQENVQSMAAGGQVTTFKIKDAQKVAELPNIKTWYGGNIGQAVTSKNNYDKQTMLFGTTEGLLETDSNFDLFNGRYFTDEEGEGLGQVTVLGSEIKNKMFGKGPAVGQKIKIGGKNFEVIGVLASRGSTGYFSFDDLVYIPIKTLQKKVMGIDYITFAFFKVKDTNKIELTTAQMQEVMRNQHDITDPDDDDFMVMSIAEAVELVEDILIAVNYMLIGLTSISLLVGGVGIMNVMYVSVTERTFEIGLRKAVGAKKGDIMQQFLYEAIALTILGGALGVTIGFAIAQTAEFAFGKFGLDISFPLSIQAIVLGIGFSAAVGVIFGLYPARRAANLSPIEALRVRR